MRFWINESEKWVSVPTKTLLNQWEWECLKIRISERERERQSLFCLVKTVVVLIRSRMRARPAAEEGKGTQPTYSAGLHLFCWCWLDPGGVICSLEFSGIQCNLVLLIGSWVVWIIKDIFPWGMDVFEELPGKECSEWICHTSRPYGFGFHLCICLC